MIAFGDIAEDNSPIITSVTVHWSLLVTFIQQIFVAQLFLSCWVWLKPLVSPVCMCRIPP